MSEEPAGNGLFVRDYHAVPKIGVDLLVASGFRAIREDIVSSQSELALDHYARFPPSGSERLKDRDVRFECGLAPLGGTGIDSDFNIVVHRNLVEQRGSNGYLQRRDDALSGSIDSVGELGFSHAIGSFYL